MSAVKFKLITTKHSKVKAESGLKFYTHSLPSKQVYTYSKQSQDLVVLTENHTLIGKPKIYPDFLNCCCHRIMD